MITFVHTRNRNGELRAQVSRVRRWLDVVGAGAVGADAMQADAVQADAVQADQVVLAVGDASCWPGAATLPAVDRDEVASALAAARTAWDRDTILVIDAARFVEFDLEGLVAEHAASPAIATLLLRPASDDAAERRADMDRTGRILRLAPAAVAPELALATTGVALLEPEILVHVPRGEPSGLEDGLFPRVLRLGGILSGWRVRDGEPRPRPRVPIGTAR